jgi:TolA-binding protein
LEVRLQMDLKVELNNFKPINLDEIIQRNEKIPDNIRNSIFLYNKAIESLRSGSEDIAAIELKKAVSMNPNFNEALNLLGICYSYIGEVEKAGEVFRRVIKAESNSILAMNYMQKLGLADTIPVQFEKPSKQPAAKQSDSLKRIRERKTYKIERKNEKRGARKTLLYYLMIGGAFAAGFLAAIVIYSMMPPKETVVPQPDQSAIDAAVNAAKQENQARVEELEKKIDSLQKEKDNAVAQTDYYKSSLKLYEIESLYRSKDYQGAADILLLMKTVQFRDAEKEKFDTLYETVMPLAAKAAYDQGYKLYNSRKYPESLKSFEKVAIYDENYDRMDAVLYYMGRCHQFAQDSRTAIALFQKLVDNYPKSGFLRSAKARINELTKLP